MEFHAHRSGANQSNRRGSSGNVDRMTRASRDAAARATEVVVFPELSLTGYPPRDLVEKPGFLERCKRELERLAQETAGLGPSVICGYVRQFPSGNGQAGPQSRRAECAPRNPIPAKQNAPAELRRLRRSPLFPPRRARKIVRPARTPVALTICEDTWNDRNFWNERLYQRIPWRNWSKPARGSDLHQRVAVQHGKRAIRRNI